MQDGQRQNQQVSGLVAQAGGMVTDSGHHQQMSLGGLLHACSYGLYEYVGQGGRANGPRSVGGVGRA